MLPPLPGFAWRKQKKTPPPLPLAARLPPQAVTHYERLRETAQGLAGEGIGWAVLLRAGLRAWCALLEATPRQSAATPIQRETVGGKGEVSREVVQVLATLVLGGYGGTNRCPDLARGSTRSALST
jgi:hypothetical protein